MASQATETIIVKGDIDHVYGVWADFANFPSFLENIESVKPTGEDQSHWVMKGPMDMTLEWDAKTTLMEKNSRIAWRSLDGNMKTSGQVTFTKLPHNEVQVTVTLSYVPPAGVADEIAASLLKVEQNLRSFKTYVEAGSDGGPPSTQEQ
jgi:uncharacterized membrane protein